MRSLLLFVLSCLFLLAGCGSGGSDTGTLLQGSSTGATPNTGSLVFNFQRAQATVPGTTVTLHFFFRNAQDQVVLERRFPYASTVEVTGVPSDASSVEIIARNNAGDFLSNLSRNVSVSPGGRTTVSLTTATFTPRFQELQAVLNGDPAQLNSGPVTIQALSLLYTDGSSEGVPLNQASLRVDDPEVIRLEGNVASGSSEGSTMLNIEVRRGQELYRRAIPLVVGAGRGLFPEFETASGLQGEGVPPGARLERLIVRYRPPFENSRELLIDDPRLTVVVGPQQALLRDNQGQAILSQGRWVLNFDEFMDISLTYDDPVNGAFTRAYAFFIDQF